jgi:hypothetical protein
MSESSSSAASGSSTGASQPDIVFLYLPRIISESKSRVGEYSWTAAHMIRADLNNIEVEQSTRSARLTLSSLVAKELESIVKEYQDSSPNTEDTPDFRRLVDEALPRLVAEAREKHPYVSFGASLTPFGLVEAQQSPETLGGICRRGGGGAGSRTGVRRRGAIRRGRRL